MNVKVTDLSFCYNKGTPFQIAALNQVTFQVGYGEVVGLIGPSGSGKSCLLRCLAGVLTPDSGTIERGELTGGAAVATGLVIQEPEQQFFADTVLEEVGYALTVRGGSPSEVREQVEQAVRQVGYQGSLNSSPFRLSGGQQRRIALASILVMEPLLLLLDEPTVGLDRQGLALIRSLVAAYRQLNRTVLLVSHDLDFLHQQVDRYLVLQAGRVLIDFPGTQFAKYREFLTENQIGLPELVKLSERKLPGYIRDYLAAVHPGSSER